MTEYYINEIAALSAERKPLAPDTEFNPIFWIFYRCGYIFPYEHKDEMKSAKRCENALKVKGNADF